mmetsp:Transcript_9510/g.14408  ORF Transcript_9510/g.14408 Transcript_9510/m.14408 type:complete len:419 (-) Transcript_9510:67-1323(-)
MTTTFSPTSSVRTSCRDLIRQSGSVSINIPALVKFSNEIAESIHSNQSLQVAEWDADGWHYTGKTYQRRQYQDDDLYELMRMERVALYILSMDAINFCFWPSSSSSAKNGLEYEHLAIALRKVAEIDDISDGRQDHADSGDSSTYVRAESSYALSPSNLATLTATKLKSLLQPHFPSSSESIVYELPEIDVRCRLLNELGTGLIDHHNGSALNMISKANQSADALVRIILKTFPGFRDYVNRDSWTNKCDACDWDAAKSSTSVIHFYKRAQIAVADIWAALGRCSTSSQRCHFTDMKLITTFPDYRVPQILRQVGALQYTPELAAKVDNQEELDEGGVDEVEIRAGTVVAVEEMVEVVKKHLIDISEADSSKKTKNNLHKLLEDVSAVTIDWYLWQRGEKEDRLNLLGPHHRVRTTYY